MSNESIEIIPSPEELIEDEKSFFLKVFARLAELRGQVGDKIKNADEESLWAELRDTPGVRSVIFGIESVAGAKPGKALDTRQALLHALSAALVFLGDTDVEGDGRPKIGRILERATPKEQNPQSKTARFFSACKSFFHENSEWTSMADQTLDGLAKYAK